MTYSPGLFLAIDQSTSATKAMLFTPDGCLLDQEAVSHPQIYPRPGWVEHDAGKIYSNTLKAASALLQRHPEQWNNGGRDTAVGREYHQPARNLCHF